MAKPSRLNELIQTVTQDVVRHPRDLTRHYAERLKISRVSANKYIRQLENAGWIARTGPSTHPVFSLGFNRRIARLYAITGLEEDVVWERDIKPFLTLSTNVQNIAGHGFTEMVNNAIDHSGGKEVFVYVDQSEKSLRISIHDDGIGIFLKITVALGLPDMRQSLFELSKGKLTTDSTKHTGEGIFFTSRMFDAFDIEANGLRYHHYEDINQDWLGEAENVFPEGTRVFLRIALNSKQTAAGVYAEFTDAPEDYDFSKTVVPMKLANYGGEQLISRSQAKRLIARFDRFRKVILDFSDVQEVGQAFADELFRVYGSSHLTVELVPINMTEQVERMWLRAMAPRAV